MGYKAQLYQDVETLEGLMTMPQERRWLESPPKSVQPRATVLYLGCNILRTPHLAQTVVAVFQRMGEDFVALAGQAFCCGVPSHYEGDADDARRLGEQLSSNFQRFQPQQVVIWCPSCLHFCESILALSGPFRLLHVTEFLAERKDRFSFEPQPSSKVAFHYHTGSPDVDRHSAAARALLEAVPGLELLEIGSSDDWGRICAGRRRNQMGLEAWEALIMPYFQRAADSGADVFATLYHGCHRMYACYEDRFPFVIEHFLTAVARSLGIEYPDKFKKYLLWKDRDRILEDARPYIETNRIEREIAAEVVDRVFVDGKGF